MSKFALEGISEVLGKEVKSLGIHVTALAPGQVRTDWAGRSMVRAERSIADYDAVIDPIRAARQAKSGKQPGDPKKAAHALLKLVESDNPPVRLYLGADALKLVGEKIEAMREEIAAWEAISQSTDFF
jgi:NAD(P)-dependent dehydrogenase (short-subunit alcohol dehydrogenase family)